MGNLFLSCRWNSFGSRVNLRPVGRYPPASITGSRTVARAARSPRLPSSHHVCDALTQRNYHQVPQANRISQSPRHLNSRPRILKSP